MNSVTLENFRCFGKRRTVRLAPLTLLVGENSTGKTSFLAAIRAMWDLGFMHEMPNFREPPFDLGGFADIVHRSGDQEAVSNRFVLGFDESTRRRGDEFEVASRFRFAGGAVEPTLVRWNLSRQGASVTMSGSPEQPGRAVRVRARTERGSWLLSGGQRLNRSRAGSFQGDLGGRWTSALWDLRFALRGIDRSTRNANGDDTLPTMVPERGGPVMRPIDSAAVEGLTIRFGRRSEERPYASSAVRTGPRRIYELSRGNSVDTGGADAPVFLANVASHDSALWDSLRGAIEAFGSAAGLFDELKVEEIGDGVGLFRIMVRKSGEAAGQWHNISEVGYGISQILPIVTVLVSASGPRVVLLQQPEVHLHPVAQAELGSLLCKTARRGRQFIVETHSDYLVDRVRLDVRDKTTDLRAGDVMILYFERRGADVEVHQIGIDGDGDLVGQPDGYREFFRREFQRVFLPGDAVTAG